MCINVNVVVCNVVCNCKSVCLSGYMEEVHVYLLFDICCAARQLRVTVCNNPSQLLVD